LADIYYRLYFYFKLVIKFIIELFYDKIAIFLSIHWYPMQEYYTFEILDKQPGLFFIRFFAKFESKCVWGSEEKWITIELYKSLPKSLTIN
jgi:hypothetical protein